MEQTLTERALNRALLARQHLLARAPRRTSLPVVLERIGGIQAQYAPSMYIGLWSRLEGFERDHLTRALERRTVVQGTLLRTTIHLVSRRDYWTLAVAIRRARREWWLRVAGGETSERELTATATRLRRRLADGPLTRAEVEAVVGRSLMSGIGLWLDMVRVPPSGTWERRRADLYEAAESWIGTEEDISADHATRHLIRRYLGGFGPSSPKEIARFGGLPLREVATALETMALRRFRDEGGGELLDLPRAPLPDPETPAPVRFLPTWDATLLTHARGTGVLAEHHRPLIFNTKMPQSAPTFLVDGAVAGTWRHEAGAVRVEPFERLSRRIDREVRDEADRLTAFHA